MNRQHDIEPYWQDEDDWLCTVEFLPSDDSKVECLPQTWSAICLATHNWRMHALWHSSAIQRLARTSLLFPFSTPGNKDQFLDLVRSNENMGSDYVENDFMSPTTEEIRNARPLVAVLPEDIVSRATLIAFAICAGAEGDLLRSQEITSWVARVRSLP